MSKVEMSLCEYDNLMEELRLYKEIVDSLTAPAMMEYNVKSYNNDGHTYLDSPLTVSRKAMNFFRDKIKENVGDIMKVVGIEGGEVSVHDSLYMSVCCISRKDDESGD